MAQRKLSSAPDDLQVVNSMDIRFTAGMDTWSEGPGLG
jgi:hypothetical protein